MPRFFFNIYNGEDVFDNVGTELQGIHQVRHRMLATARGWIEQEKHQDADWCLEARDEDEKVIATMRFGVDRASDDPK